jgi:Rad3-related DNA helicase
MDLLQAYGRGIRNENDYCSFYVLDSDIKRLLKTDKDLFSRYFLEAIQK